MRLELSSEGRYALRALLYLAWLGEQASADRISAEANVPRRLLALFCLRYLIPEERWSERAAKWSFWSLNIGLAWMCFAKLFPLGILQLYQSVERGLL